MMNEMLAWTRQKDSNVAKTNIKKQHQTLYLYQTYPLTQTFV